MPDTIKKKLVQILIPPSMELQIKEMGAHFNMGNAVLIRYAVTNLYNGDFRKLKFGYHGGLDTGKLRVGSAKKRNNRDEQIKAIKEMSNDQIMAWLKEIGFPLDRPEGEVVNQATGAVRRFIMRSEENGIRVFAEQHVSPGNKIDFDSPWYFNIDDLIKDLIKDKLI